MDDLISKQAAIEEVMNHYRVGDKPQNEEMDWCVKMLHELPTAEKKGRWVYDEERGATGIYAICTACNEMIYQTGEFNYCPNCGARMEESDE